MISNKDLKAKFINKLHVQYKSLHKAFTEMNKLKTGLIKFEEFYQLVKSWGFDANEVNIKDLFEWLDFDNDNQISYEDLRSTAGKEISPMEQLFFRQDLKPRKTINCKYFRCWENNNFNTKSLYCNLHQKIIRNLCLDMFSQIV